MARPQQPVSDTVSGLDRVLSTFRWVMSAAPRYTYSTTRVGARQSTHSSRQWRARAKQLSSIFILTLSSVYCRCMESWTYPKLLPNATFEDSGPRLYRLTITAFGKIVRKGKWGDLERATGRDLDVRTSWTNWLSIRLQRFAMNFLWKSSPTNPTIIRMFCLERYTYSD